VLLAGAEDIGTWYLILEIMSVMAVICNSAIIFFTGERFAHLSMFRRTLYFIIFEHLVLGFKVAMAAFIPDVPVSVNIQLKRQELLTSKVSTHPYFHPSIHPSILTGSTIQCIFGC